jgi:putative chitinase
VIDLDILRAICPLTKTTVLEPFVDPLNATMTEFEIDNVQRETMFLAQLAHESGGFHYVREIASGAAYEYRADLGNTKPGDGVLFKGRGLIQITGRINYERCGVALGLDLIAQPELLESPENAARSAGWFWWAHECNELADAADFLHITRRINGGLNGYPDRQAYLKRAEGAMA